MSQEVDYYKNLAEIMLKTRGARFTAAQRLISHERFSVVTLALLSIFLISVAISLLSAPDSIDAGAARFLGALSIVASVWILAITLFDYAFGRGLLAYRLHRNALRITRIMRSLERELARETPDMSTVRAIAEEYETEISEAEVNHSSSDYKLSIYQRQKPITVFQKVYFPIRILAFRIGVFICSVPSNLMIMAIIAVSLIWYFIIR